MTFGGRSTRRLMAGLALAAAGLLAGCLAESEHPIAAADPAGNDARLWGSWLSEEEDGYVVAHVFATEDHALRIAIAEHGAEGMGDMDTYDAHATRLPSGDYLNVMVTGSEPGYVIARYRFDGVDRISVWSADDGVLVRAVEDGKLPGTTKVEAGEVDVRITATPEQWQAFLAKAPAELFGEPTQFKRIGPAYVGQQ